MKTNELLLLCLLIVIGLNVLAWIKLNQATAKIRKLSNRPVRVRRRKRVKSWWGLTLLLLVACSSAGTVYIDPRSAFVYPDGDQIVLVLGTGEYRLAGETMPAGCYRLEPPGLFESRGEAQWIGETCEIVGGGE